MATFAYPYECFASGKHPSADRFDGGLDLYDIDED